MLKSEHVPASDFLLSDQDWEQVELTAQLLSITHVHACKIVCDRLGIPAVELDTHIRMMFFSMKINAARARLNTKQP